MLQIIEQQFDILKLLVKYQIWWKEGFPKQTNALPLHVLKQPKKTIITSSNSGTGQEKGEEAEEKKSKHQICVAGQATIIPLPFKGIYKKNPNIGLIKIICLLLRNIDS